MAEVTAEQLAKALAETTTKPKYKECFFTIGHGGIDGYERNQQLTQFMGEMRRVALSAASRFAADWPHPSTVTKADVWIEARGERCRHRTLAQMEVFFAKHFYAGANALAKPVEPKIVKGGKPGIKVWIRALEITVPENPADKAARLAREAAPPAVRADGTIEGELREWETPAFLTDQGIADVDPLEHRLDEMERAVQIPKPEDDADPPSVIYSEDPVGASKRWGGLMAHPTESKGGGGSGQSGKRVFANPMCECGDRASDHGEPGSGTGCRKCSTCSGFIQASSGGRPRKGIEVREVISARVDTLTRAAFNAGEHGYGEVLDLAASLMLQGVDVVAHLEALALDKAS